MMEECEGTKEEAKKDTASISSPAEGREVETEI
jgi:hypothetical protein